MSLCFFFFFKQKTAYEMVMSDWSSDVCSSDLRAAAPHARRPPLPRSAAPPGPDRRLARLDGGLRRHAALRRPRAAPAASRRATERDLPRAPGARARPTPARAVRRVPRQRAPRRFRPLDPLPRARVLSRPRLPRRHGRAGADLISPRGARRGARRAPLGGQAQLADRPRRDGRGARRTVGADVLPRDPLHPPAVAQGRPLPHGRTRRLEAPGPAGAHAGRLRDGVHRAADALGGARCAARGLHPDGAGQGRRGVDRGRQAHAQERRDPNRDDHGAPVRDAARRRGRHRDGLRVAGDRPPRDPVHLQPRLPRRAVRGLPLRDRFHRHQLRDRPALRLPRPARPTMTIDAATGTSLKPPTESSGLAGPAPTLRARRTARLAMAGFAFVLLLGAVAVAAPWLAPHDPTRQSLRDRLAPPTLEAPDGRARLLGTDHLGRDVLSRVIYGARVSLVVGLSAVVVGGALGATLGIAAGFRGGFADSVIMTLADAQLAFPFILLAIGIIAVLGPSFPTLIVGIGLSGWVNYARVLRSQVLVLRSREFVDAILALGGAVPRIVARHILPNVLSTLVVIATLQLARAIVLEATLSFLGLGIQPPTPSWGGMIHEGREYLDTAWWISTFPGLVLMLTSIVVSRTGDWLRDLLDPTLRGE